jgi:hypothetical protein
MLYNVLKVLRKHLKVVVGNIIWKDLTRDQGKGDADLNVSKLRGDVCGTASSDG